MPVASGCKRGCRTIALFLLLLLIAGAAVGAWFWHGYNRFADQPLQQITQPHSVEVASGDSFARVLRKIREQGVSTGTDLEWQALARQLDAAGKLKVGEYALVPGTTRAICCSACATARPCNTASPLWKAGTSANCATR